MNLARPMFTIRPCLLFICLLCLQAFRAFASDGFDNNYFGGDANQMMVQIDGQNRIAVFGPGDQSSGSFYIKVPNNGSADIGSINTFLITGAASYLRSAYLDRVMTTKLFYRIYPVASVPPATWNILSLDPQSSLSPSTCYAQTQNNIWQKNESIDLIAGLANGSYVLEFYMQSDLYDVGLEPDPCMINADDQCTTVEQHNGRYISSRFNVTDPTVCELANILANQAAPSRIYFQLANQPPVSVETVAGNGYPALALWPNPAAGESLHFALPENRTVATLRVFNGRGQLIIDAARSGETGGCVPVGHLAAGIYTVIAFDAQGRVAGAGRFIRQGPN